MQTRRVLAAAVLALCLAQAAQAETLRVVAFNVESGGADPSTIAQQISTMGAVDIWGLSEVKNFAWAMQFKAAVMAATGDPYWFIFGNTGGEDRLVLLYNQDTLEELDTEELHDINPEGRVRAPLVAHFRIKGTSQEFKAVVNHLYRKRANLRHQQARQLRAWAETQTVPVITLGDFNFDWESDTDHDTGFDELTSGNVFTWVRPSNLLLDGNLLPTQCHTDFRSVLDFVFVGGDAQDWSGSSQILFPQPEYCPDDNLTSDHRPVEATFTLPAMAPPRPPGQADALEELRIAVEALEQALEEVKARLAALEDE